MTLCITFFSDLMDPEPLDLMGCSTLPDSETHNTSSDSSNIEDSLQYTAKELDHNTIPQSAMASAIARYMTPAQANPVVGRITSKRRYHTLTI